MTGEKEGVAKGQRRRKDLLSSATLQLKTDAKRGNCPPERIFLPKLESRQIFRRKSHLIENFEQKLKRKRPFI
ncbi:hypothetical protein HMPREF0262_02200 [Clostridium sp. ATCC 29733]|nr:hypothetical protein HMPREF0262_02200 [Clostridium sp. ATCC 29733]